jgi:hypothetical protein
MALMRKLALSLLKQTLPKTASLASAKQPLWTPIFSWKSWREPRSWRSFDDFALGCDSCLGLTEADLFAACQRNWYATEICSSVDAKG